VFKDLSDHITETEMKLKITGKYLNAFEEFSEQNVKVVNKFDQDLTFIKIKQEHIKNDLKFIMEQQEIRLKYLIEQLGKKNQ
jgi:hypothetical protein